MQYRITEMQIEDDNKELKHYSLSKSIPDTCERLPVPFRVMDDDGLVYLEGACDVISFTPLNELGRQYGATDIQFYDKAKEIWEFL